MKIAVTYNDGEIFQHFGHSNQFKIYNVIDNKILDEEVVNTNGSGHGELVTFLAKSDVSTLICGGIGGGAKAALEKSGIKLYGGVKGNADKAVKALLSEKLDFNPDVSCSHHDEEHKNNGHVCGEHGCGNHSC